MFKHTVNVWGWAEDEAGAAAAAKTLKQCLSQLNTHLEGKGWLVGGRLTLADIVVFNALIAPFNYLFDAGFRKAVPSAVAWFEKVSKLPFVARNAGFLKMMGAGKQQPATAAAGAQKQKGGKQEQPKKAGGKGKPAAKKEEEDDGDFDPFADDGEDDAVSKRPTFALTVLYRLLPRKLSRQRPPRSRRVRSHPPSPSPSSSSRLSPGGQKRTLTFSVRRSSLKSRWTASAGRLSSRRSQSHTVCSRSS